MSGAEDKKPLNVLVIEDSEIDALLLVEQLREGGYEPTSQRVESASELTSALAEHSWDIIFSDHNMPQFSSTEALKMVREFSADVPFIIVSGAIGEDAAVSAMRAGAQDYMMKGNMTRLVAAVDRELMDAQERKARRAAERTLLVQEEEFRIARDVQQKLYPAEAPRVPGMDIAGFSRPATAAGGDYFDFIPTPQGRLLVVIGDVTGHGLGPAMLMAAARAYLRALVLTEERFEMILARARQLLIEDLGWEHFITLLFAELDPATRRLRYINAGHPAGYVFDAGGNLRAEMMPSTPALGIDRDGEELTATELQLEEGDMVVLLTDGIMEAQSEALEEFSEERTIEVIRRERGRPAEEVIRTLIEEADRFSVPDSPNQDDMTVVVIKCGEGAVPS